MRRRFVARHVHEIVIGVLLAVILGVGAWLEPGFVSLDTQLDLSSHATELALLALPMTLIIISGGIDLSVGSTMALAAVTLGLLFEAGAPIWAASLAAIGTGALAGSLNGVFVAHVRVHPLIVTLASLAAFRGLAEGISRGRPISGFPSGFLRLGEGAIGGVPYPMLIVAAAAVGFAAFAWRTVPGFRIYAVGDNERAARYSGVPVDRLKLALYTLSGAAAGVAAVLFAARRNTAKADVGAGIELEVITAVVLGGTSTTGGRGSILGAILGVAIIHEVRELVSWHWRHDELILIVTGAILIASVLVNNIAPSRRA